jgi:hypothetical protein
MDNLEQRKEEALVFVSLSTASRVAKLWRPRWSAETASFASAALDGKMALSRAIVQLSGEAMVCSVAGLRGAAMQSQSLLSLLIRHEQTLYAQAQQSAACMAAHHVDAHKYKPSEAVMDGSRSERARARARDLLAQIAPLPDDTEVQRLRELSVSSFARPKDSNETVSPRGSLANKFPLP